MLLALTTAVGTKYMQLWQSIENLNVDEVQTRCTCTWCVYLPEAAAPAAAEEPEEAAAAEAELSSSTFFGGGVEAGTSTTFFGGGVLTGTSTTYSALGGGGGGE